MFTIFKSATNAPRFRFPDVSAYHMIMALLTIVLAQIAIIAWLVDFRVLCATACAWALVVVYQAVKS